MAAAATAPATAAAPVASAVVAPRRPTSFPGTAQVRGSLDKEIIRRIIRRHLNEVKFCYEKELMHKADLYGRVMVQFTISGTGQVIASIVSNSTMNNASVDRCIADAVKRWEFPKPQGGGIVIVSYPFVPQGRGRGISLARSLASPSPLEMIGSRHETSHRCCNARRRDGLQ